MKTMTLLFTLMLISITGIAQAENCAISFYCYGNTNPQTVGGNVNVGYTDNTPANNNLRTTANQSTRRNANQSSCLQNYNTLLNKAKKLDELANAQTRANRLDQAKRLLNNAITLRNTAARLPCKP